MRVLFYRDCRALNRIQIAKATVEGTVVSDAYTVRPLQHNPRLVQLARGFAILNVFSRPAHEYVFCLFLKQVYM